MIIGLVPARSGSKRIRNKNIFKLNGKPLVQYTLEAAKNSKLLDDIVVTTDSKKIIKLSSNEGAFGASPKIKKIIKEFENKIFRYPDPESNKLKEEISKKYKLNKNNIICGNGSDEILATIAKIFSGPGDEILYSEYGFLMYTIA